MAKRKLVNILTPSAQERLYSPSINDVKPTISITYLDKNQYNFKKLFKETRGNSDYVKAFQDFLEKAKKYKSIMELIDNHKPKEKLNNADKKSIDKVKLLRSEYNLDVTELIHLHCCTNGSGEFVLHGFEASNHFEIVWLDPKHEIHSK